MGASQDAVPNPERGRGDVPAEDIDSLIYGDATDAGIAVDLDSETVLDALAVFDLPEAVDTEERDDEEAAEMLRSRAADADMLELLRFLGVKGPLWDRFTEPLLDYAAQVLDVWVANRKVYQELWRLNVPLCVHEDEKRRLSVDADYREELVDNAIADAVVKLRTEILAGKGWNPTGGASLSSYFVGKCAIAFADALVKGLRWERHRSEGGLRDFDAGADDLFEVLTEPRSAELRQPLLFDAPEQRAVDNDTIRTHLGALDPDDRDLVWWKVNNYTTGEIAEFTGKTIKAIERRWFRLKRKHDWINRLSLSSVRNPS
ncbi:hypothetical protein ACIA5E_18605 [Nocardia asteroides]|uniref:hypothetical protein n=1 Tax=Nocardia asteroides TaxID=1824 RepID=UPI0037BBE5FC